MTKPRIQIGTFGTITFITRPSGRVEARARYRDWDGKARIVQATAKSRPVAERAVEGEAVRADAGAAVVHHAHA